MPTISAGIFFRFAYLSARAKDRMIGRAVAGDWPGYAVPPDHWVRLRHGLQRMIRTGDTSPKAIADILAKVPIDRRGQIAEILTGFAAAWPQLRARKAPGQSLFVRYGDLTVRCRPHTTIVASRRVIAVRFSYGHTRLRNLAERRQLELLRQACAGTSSHAATLTAITASVGMVRPDASADAFLRAEAQAFRSLWRQHGGPP